MPFNPLGYPLDLTGVAVTNHILNEVHTFGTLESRVFVPSVGPFFTDGFEIRNNANNALLQPNSDYKLVHLHKEGTLESGKNVCAAVYVENVNIGAVKISYHALGGNYADTSDTIRDLILNNPINDPATVTWGHVFGAPVQFAPVEHLHHIDEIYNMQDLVAALEQLRIAVLVGDNFAFDAVYQYIQNFIANSDFATMNDLTNAIPPTANPVIKTYATYADLIAETDFVNNTPRLYVALGKDSIGDGKGRVFYWDITDVTPADGDKILHPTIILPAGNGRLRSTLAVEKDLKNVLTTLGRRIEPDGSVNSKLSLIAHMGGVDLNQFLEAGDYWVDETSTNGPGNNVSGKLTVTHVTIDLQHQKIESVYGDEITGAVTNTPKAVRRIYTRVVHRPTGTNDPYTFESWVSNTPDVVAKQHGINSILNTDTPLSTLIDFDSLVYSGVYGFSGTGFNTPFAEAGKVEVTILSGTQVSPADIMQEATSVTNVKKTRSRVSGVWTDWVEIVTLDNLPVVLDCALGLGVETAGGIIGIVAAYIGEVDNNTHLVDVFLNDRWVNLSIYDIPPVTFEEATLTAFTRGYIYLEEDNGVFSIITSDKPPEYKKDTVMTNGRPNLYEFTSIGLVVNYSRLFLGMYAVTDNNPKTIITRSWFRDPGAVEWKVKTVDGGDTVFTGAITHLIINDDLIIENNGGVSNVIYADTYLTPPPKSHILAWGGENITFHTVFKHSFIQADASIKVGFIKTDYVVHPLDATHSQTNFYQTSDLINMPGRGLNEPANGIVQTNAKSTPYRVTEDSVLTLSLDGGLYDGVSGDKIVISGIGGTPPGRSSVAAVLHEVHRFRKLTIQKASLLNWLPNILSVNITGTRTDLNLRDEFFAVYGFYPSSGTTVKFYVNSGASVLATSTAGYAITNPSNWVAGVIVHLVVQANAIVAGKGGEGGRGGQAFVFDNVNYYGGVTSNPSSPVHAKAGGEAILNNYALTIYAAATGIISVGRGGGGGSGGLIVYSASSPWGYAIAGSGGGGGWPNGTGGLAGKGNLADTNPPYYVYNNTNGDTIYHQPGEPGLNASPFSPPTAVGGLGTQLSSGGTIGTTGQGGSGGGKPGVGSYSDGGPGVSWTGGVAYGGEGGNGGNDGTWAVRSPVAPVTVFNSGAIIYGTVDNATYL